MPNVLYLSIVVYLALIFPLVLGHTIEEIDCQFDFDGLQYDLCSYLKYPKSAFVVETDSFFNSYMWQAAQDRYPCGEGIWICHIDTNPGHEGFDVRVSSSVKLVNVTMENQTVTLTLGNEGRYGLTGARIHFVCDLTAEESTKPTWSLGEHMKDLNGPSFIWRSKHACTVNAHRLSVDEPGMAPIMGALATEAETTPISFHFWLAIVSFILVLIVLALSRQRPGTFFGRAARFNPFERLFHRTRDMPLDLRDHDDKETLWASGEMWEKLDGDVLFGKGVY